MAFPVTINGRTYTLADFEGTNYVDGFPDALEDFVTQAGDIYNSTSTSSVAIGTGSKSFTTADSDKPYQPGTPLRIADAAAPATNFMDCIVTSYSGTSLVVDAIGFGGSGTKSSWTINIGGAKTVDGTLAVNQGGTGATTASAAASNLGLGTEDSPTFTGLTVTSSGDFSGATISDLGTVTTADINGGTIDGVTIGGASAGAGTFTDLTANGGDMLLDSSGDSVFTIAVGGTSNNARIDFNNGTDVDGGITYDHDSAFASEKLHLRAGNNGTHVTLTGGGNLGIGTQSPNHELEVAAVAPILRITDTDTTATSGQELGKLEFYTSDADGAHVGADIACYSDDSLGRVNGLSFSVSQSNFADATEAMRIDSSGHLIVPNGVTLGTATGTYSAVNTLDDYEEGTWTPAWAVDSGSITANSNTSGRYTKIGRMVYIQGYISYQSNSSASGTVTVTGLPFTSVASGFGQASNQSGGVSAFANSLWSSNAPDQGRIQSNSTQIEPSKTTGASADPLQFSDFSKNTNHSQFVFFGHYYVD